MLALVEGAADGEGATVDVAPAQLETQLFVETARGACCQGRVKSWWARAARGRGRPTLHRTVPVRETSLPWPPAHRRCLARAAATELGGEAVSGATRHLVEALEVFGARIA
jgi:hypothetical protein